MRMILILMTFATGSVLCIGNVVAATGDITWVNQVNVVTTPTSITKTGAAGWNGGAVSVETLSGDGYVEFRSVGVGAMIGLSNGDSDQRWQDIDFAIYPNSNGLYVYEAGSSRGYFGNFTANDVLRIEISNGQVEYKKNGAILYSHATAPTFPLNVDTSLYTVGDSITDISLVSTEGNVSWINKVNVSTTPASITKTSGGAVWNAGAVSSETLSGDGYVEYQIDAGTSAMIGLSNGDTNQSYNTIDFAIFNAAVGQFHVYESGVLTPIYGPFTPDDVFRVQVSSGQVQYMKNGSVFHTSATTPTFPLNVDTSLHTVGGFITDISLVSTAPPPTSLYGFHDPGLITAKVRSDYDPDSSGAFTAGTAGNLLALDSATECLWPDSEPGNFVPVGGKYDDGLLDQSQEKCPVAEIVYTSANPYEQNGGDTSPTFWVLSVNNERSFSSDNPGPPNQSLPVVWPGSGIMGFSMITDPPETFWRAHMVVNQFSPGPAFVNPNTIGAIPFMSIGAQYNRGNGGLLTVINDPNAPQILTWTSKLWDAKVPGGVFANQHILIISAIWDGIPHQIQLYLYNDSNTGFPPFPGANFKWNWPAQGSFWHPGADIAFMNAVDADQDCFGVDMTQMTTVGDEIAYSVNIENLLRCASDFLLFSSQMPGSIEVPVTGIHWAVEVAGGAGSALWASVHGMRLH